MNKELTPLKAIRAKCIECSGGQLAEVRNCVIENCALYPYRMGSNPARKGKGGVTPKRSNLTKNAHTTADFEKTGTLL